MKDLKVLDSKAAQNISILLGGLLKHMSYEEVKKNILRCDDQALPDSVLQQLINYLPPPDQLHKLEEYRSCYDDLTEAEQFAITVSEHYLVGRTVNFEVLDFGRLMGIAPKFTCSLGHAKCVSRKPTASEF